MTKFLYFSAEWCGPCRMYGPIMENLSKEENINVTKVDVDKEPELAMKYGIRSIPTTLIVDDEGVVLKKFIGVQTADQLVRVAEELDK
jgi:thioredoxin 1